MFEFVHNDHDNRTEVRYTIDRDDITWTELTDAYIDFLRASGFVFSEESIKEYFTNNLGDIHYAVNRKEE